MLPKVNKLLTSAILLIVISSLNSAPIALKTYQTELNLVKNTPTPGLNQHKPSTTNSTTVACGANQGGPNCLLCAKSNPSQCAVCNNKTTTTYVNLNGSCIACGTSSFLHCSKCSSDTGCSTCTTNYTLTDLSSYPGFKVCVIVPQGSSNLWFYLMLIGLPLLIVVGGCVIAYFLCCQPSKKNELFDSLVGDQDFSDSDEGIQQGNTSSGDLGTGDGEFPRDNVI